MPEESISQELALYMAGHVRSVEQLEVLLTLWTVPLKEWLAEEVYERVKSNRTSVVLRLEELVVGGLVMQIAGDPPRYRYQPQTQQLGTLVSELAAAYRWSPVRVIETIYSPATAALREFAQAFRLKKDP